jgi:hypothetical protein
LILDRQVLQKKIDLNKLVWEKSLWS